MEQNHPCFIKQCRHFPIFQLDLKDCFYLLNSRENDAIGFRDGPPGPVGRRRMQNGSDGVLKPAPSACWT
jgi:hypothetical protein